MVTVSNEAEELHKMCNMLMGLNTPGSTMEVLSRLFKVEPESYEYSLYISALKLRFKRFLDAAETSSLSERHKQNLRNAVRKLQAFTEVRFASGAWSDAVRNVFDKTQLMALDMAGSGLSSISPVIVLDKLERKEHIQKLQDILEGIDGSHDFMAELVGQAVRTAVRMIELFDIFGSAAISEHLVKTHAIAKEAAVVAPQGRRGSYRKAAAIVGVVLGALVSADGVFTAVENFYTRAEKFAEIIALAQPPEQKLLPAPSDPAQQDQPEDTDSEAEKQTGI